MAKPFIAVAVILKRKATCTPSLLVAIISHLISYKVIIMQKQKQLFRQWLVATFTLWLFPFISYGQCPDPAIISFPNPACSGPIELKLNNVYAAYQWSTGSLSPNILVTASGTYSVTVKCDNGEIKTTSLALSVPNRVATLSPTTFRKCLPESPVNLTINIANGGAPAYPGPYYFKVVELPSNDTIELNFEMPPFTFTANPGAEGSYRLISAIANDCTLNIGLPNKTTVTSVFEDISQYPSVEGDFIICEGETTLITNSATIDPLSYYWIVGGNTIPSIVNVFNFFGPGSYWAGAVYSAQCTVQENFVITQNEPIPVLQAGPVCAGNPTTVSTTVPWAGYQWSNGSTDPTIEVDQPGTYTVTITDDEGCTGLDNVNVQGYPEPVVNIFGPTGLCSNQTSASLVANGFNIQSYTWSTGETTNNITINGAGSYTVTVVDQQGCTTEQTQDVEAIQVPIVQLTPKNLCQGSSLVLTPIVSTPDPNFQWSNGATTSSITVTTGGLYRVTVSDPSLTCSTTAFSLVTVIPLPVVNIQTSNSNICEGKTANLAASGNGTSFVWSTGSNSSNINTAAAGTYTVTVTGANGCTNTDTETITVLPAPKPVIAGPRSLCGNDSILLSIPAFPVRQWSTGDTTSGIWVKSIGTYSVQVTGSNGCTGGATANIVSSTPGILNVAGPLSLCNTDSITLVASGPFATFNWSNGVSNDSVIIKTGGIYTVLATDNVGCTATQSLNVGNGGNFATNIAFTALCNQSAQLDAQSGFAAYNWSNGSTLPFTLANQLGNYTVTVTNAEGCTSTTSYLVTTLPGQPSVAFSGNTEICPGASTTLSLTSAFSAVAWSTGSTSNTTTISQPGTYTVSVTDALGCSNTLSINVAGLNPPQTEITGSLSLCNGSATTLGTTGTFANVAWSTGANTPQIAVTTAGTYTVTVTALNGCTSTAWATVNTAAALSPTIGTEPYACNGQLILNGGAGFNTYSWSTGATTPTLTINESGTYTLTVSNTDGCTGSATLSVTIPTTAAVSISGSAFFCSAVGTNLTATTGFTSYAWNTGATSSVINVNTSGTYNVTATDANGCTASSGITVGAQPSPMPQLGLLPYQCTGFVTLATQEPFNTYSWNNGTANSTITTDQAGIYTVTVTAPNGCTGTDDFFVASVPDLPLVEISGPMSICPSTEATLTATAGFTTYAWSTGSGNSSIIVDTAGEYTVTATDSDGCTATAVLVVNLIVTPVPLISASPYLCDGTLTLQASPGYVSYLWPSGNNSNVQIVIANGNYTVTVTGVDGCTATATFAATIPAIPNTAILQSPGTGNSIVLTADAGFQSYIWSNGSQTQNTSVNTSGTYTVTVTDANGCTATATTAVSIVTLPLNVVAAQTFITCFNAADGQLTLCINEGQAPYTIVSSPSVPFTTTSTAGCDQLVTYSGIPPGGFQWTVTDASGVSFNNLAIFPNPSALIASASVVGNTISVTAIGGTPGYQYSLDGTNYQISSTFNNVPAGSYTVYVKDSNGCVEVLENILISSARDLTVQWQLQVLPNPSDGMFQLRLNNCEADAVQLRITDVAGRVLQERHLDTDGCNNVQQTIDLANSPSGAYFLQIRTELASKTLVLVRQ